MDPLTIVESIPAVGPYVPYITLVVAIGAAVATVLPPPAADASTAYRVAYEVVQWCALNKGHAANAPAPKP